MVLGGVKMAIMIGAMGSLDGGDGNGDRGRKGGGNGMWWKRRCGLVFINGIRRKIRWVYLNFRNVLRRLHDFNQGVKWSYTCMMGAS